MELDRSRRYLQGGPCTSPSSRDCQPPSECTAAEGKARIVRWLCLLKQSLAFLEGSYLERLNNAMTED